MADLDKIREQLCSLAESAPEEVRAALEQQLARADFLDRLASKMEYIPLVNVDPDDSNQDDSGLLHYLVTSILNGNRHRKVDILVPDIVPVLGEQVGVKIGYEPSLSDSGEPREGYLAGTNYTIGYGTYLFADATICVAREYQYRFARSESSNLYMQVLTALPDQSHAPCVTPALLDNI